MNRKEVFEILFKLQNAYLNFCKNYSEDELKCLLDLWSEHLKNENKEIVNSVIYDWIEESNQYPTIRDVKEKIRSQESKKKWDAYYDN